MKDIDPGLLVPLEVDARTREEIDRILRVHVLAAASQNITTTQNNKVAERGGRWITSG
jgi:hypothetical protein